MSEKTPISANELLAIANQMIKEHDAYLEGMLANSVDEKAGVMVFKGEYFLDDNGLPTPKTTAVFNMFKYLAHQLSKQYTLQ
ncbi:YciN family protein [Enterovibrio sp. ZSDZ42]|uniref:YciN family protein n=1 Tax=Enterovibrio gelatinilyticus TaxID=2899819 RepID=A0ABT5R762_9GAMM|nr:YciN family protein [Enterovibrio sp. ZSDZ42]MDD1796114.1 YciN family protein [Enterovibrio sp. ZSDZ42]